MKPFMHYPSRFWIAGWLSRIACWLRGEKWYVADTWHGVPGNRAAELRQRIWMRCVTLEALDKGTCDLEAIDSDLTELAQAAGEAWGHIWPKGQKPE